MTDERSQELLEFPQIRARLAAHTAFGPSRRLAETLSPSSDPVVAARQLDETDEARDCLGQRPDAGVGSARDIGPVIGRANRGGRLSGTELLAVLETLTAAGRLADALRSEDRKSTRLNSSHLVISYAVFCLKNNKHIIQSIIH